MKTLEEYIALVVAAAKAGDRVELRRALYNLHRSTHSTPGGLVGAVSRYEASPIGEDGEKTVEAMNALAQAFEKFDIDTVDAEVLPRGEARKAHEKLNREAVQREEAEKAKAEKPERKTSRQTAGAGASSE